MRGIGAAAVGVVVIAIGAVALAGDRIIDGAAAPPDRPSTATVADIYVVAVTGRPGPVHLAEPVFIRDYICPLSPDPADPSDVPCEPESIPTAVQNAVTDQLGTQARFRAEPPAVGERGPTVYDLGELTVVGSRATIDIESRCGPLCGSGETLSLARANNGQWMITDRVTHWLS